MGVRSWSEIAEKPFLFLDGELLIAPGIKTHAEILKDSGKVVNNSTIAGEIIFDGPINVFVKACAVSELGIVRKDPMPVVDFIRQIAPNRFNIDPLAQL